MNTDTEVMATKKPRRVPLWVWDVVAALFLLSIWVVSARTEVAAALGEGREPSVPVMVPAVLVAYGLYRLFRKAVKGSAYPQPKVRGACVRLAK